MDDADTTTLPPPRKEPRAVRRSQLIEATIETLALRGYARTTLTEVARVAGLSHGLVNFHFDNKEKLLAETLAYLAEEYTQNWAIHLKAAGDDPVAQMDALIRADFAPEVCTPSRLSVWCSFWGEAQFRPLYQEKCGSNDANYIRVREDICAGFMREGGYAGNPTAFARVLRNTTEGVWLDLTTMIAPYSLIEGRATVFTCASALFPRHFGPEGMLPR